MNNAQEFCTAVAGGLMDMGFEPTLIMAILTTMLPAMLSLCGKTNEQVTQKRLERAYRPDLDPPYSKPVVRKTMRRAKWAAEENGAELNDEQARQVAGQFLEQAHGAKRSQFSLVYREVETQEESALRAFAASKHYDGLDAA